MMSVRYAFRTKFRLSLIFCLDSASDAIVFAGPGAEPAGREVIDTVGPQLPEACRLMTWHHDCTRSCQATAY
jgi:hypothetical protein